MSTTIDWDQLSNHVSTQRVLEIINDVILKARGVMMGGYAYIESINLGDEGPRLHIKELSANPDASALTARIGVTFGNNVEIKVRALAQFNPMAATDPFSFHTALHMGVTQAQIPGYLPAWAIIRDVQLDLELVLNYFASTSAPNATSTSNADKSQSPAQPSVLRISCPRFPLKCVRVETCLDGSVLIDKILEGISTAMPSKLEAELPIPPEVDASIRAFLSLQEAVISHAELAEQAAAAAVATSR